MRIYMIISISLTCTPYPTFSKKAMLVNLCPVLRATCMIGLLELKPNLIHLNVKTFIPNKSL